MDLSVTTVKISLVSAMLLLCTACGYLFGDEGVFRDRSEDYKKSHEVPVIEVPAGADSSALQEIYPIPPISDDLLLAGKFEVPRPTPLVAGAADELVRIQTLGGESWALVSTPPGQVWPQVRSFLSASQIPVARVDAREGILESGWLELEGQSMGSRFRYRIDKGVQRDTSELHVLQMNQAGDLDNWPQTSDNAAQENEMLRALAQYIANSADSTPVSMMADQAMSATGKISIQEGPDNDLYIRLSLPYDRAWASVGRALEESSFEITDRDRSAGKYYVRFIGPESEEEAGWFDWILNTDSKHPLAGRHFIVSVESLDDQDEAIRIEPPLTSPEGEPVTLEKQDEQALLVLLKGNID
jgi:outer membrane protein assembly factor BamC